MVKVHFFVSCSFLQLCNAAWKGESLRDSRSPSSVRRAILVNWNQKSKRCGTPFTTCGQVCLSFHSIMLLILVSQKCKHKSLFLKGNILNILQLSYIWKIWSLLKEEVFAGWFQICILSLELFL